MPRIKKEKQIVAGTQKGAFSPPFDSLRLIAITERVLFQSAHHWHRAHNYIQCTHREFL
jgi:hypothetical protein